MAAVVGRQEDRQEVMGVVEDKSSRLLRLSQFHPAEADMVSVEERMMNSIIVGFFRLRYAGQNNKYHERIFPMNSE